MMWWFRHRWMYVWRFRGKRINGECVFYLHSLPIFDPSTTCKNLFAIPPEQLQLLFSHGLIVCVSRECWILSKTAIYPFRLHPYFTYLKTKLGVWWITSKRLVETISCKNVLEVWKTNGLFFQAWLKICGMAECRYTCSRGRQCNIFDLSHFCLVDFTFSNLEAALHLQLQIEVKQIRFDNQTLIWIDDDP